MNNKLLTIDTLPDNCYPKNKLAKALKINTIRLQYYTKLADFISPDGYYITSNKNKRKCPYWNINRVKNYIENADINFKAPPREKIEGAAFYMKDMPAYAIPQHDWHEIESCLKTRQALKLMSVSVC